MVVEIFANLGIKDAIAHLEITANPANDHLIFSKGHASPLLYAVLKAIGAIDDDMMLSLRRLGSPIQGHPAPVPELPWVEAATGSLGQGPAIGLGMALGMRLWESPARVWVLVGDSERVDHLRRALGEGGDAVAVAVGSRRSVRSPHTEDAAEQHHEGNQCL